MAKYFLVQSASYLNLAHSVHHGRWAVPPAVLQQIKTASETSDEVFCSLQLDQASITREWRGWLVSACSDQPVRPACLSGPMCESVSWE
ncbi:hypothetical protein C6341_g21710 [Phytophthora cactorum]|nr:hypothetical protein C6341_g21710 [Phytophthora cactorum]